VEEKLAFSPATQMPRGPSVKTPEGVRTVGSSKAMTVDYVKLAEAVEKTQKFLSSWVGYR
jgi:hypothetical protein